MRSISGTLLAAQKAASAEPYVRVIAENRLAGVVRLDPTVADSTANPIAAHGAAICNNAALVRARVDAGNVKTSRTANLLFAISTTWVTQQTGKGARCACAATANTCGVAYTDAANTGIKLIESADGGITFGAEQAVTVAAGAINMLAISYKSNGDVAIAWVEAAAMKIIRRVAGVWQAPSTCGAVVASYTGVAVYHDGGDWRIVATGTETATNRPTVWTLTHGDGFDAAVGTWTAFQIQQQAESDASVTYWSPYLGFADIYRMTFVEVDAFTGGSTRVYRSSIVYPLGWNAGDFTWRTPVPVNYGQAYGLAVAVATTAYIETANDQVLRAFRNLATTDLSARVLAADVTESDHQLGGHVDIDNTDGAYAGPPSPLAVGNFVAVGWGYKTSAGSEYSQMADMEISAIEYVRTGGVSAIRLQLTGGWARLRRNRQRTSIYHAAASLSYTQILTRLFARAGLLLGTSSPSSRAGTIKPAFQIAPQTDSYTAMRQVLAFIADRIRMSTSNSATMTEPLSSAATQYTFGTDHAVYDSDIVVAQVPASEAYAFGAGAFGEAIDYANAQAYLGTREYQRDLTSTTGAQASATATAHLRQVQLEQPGGQLVVPPCCGLETLDVIDISDTLVNAAAVKRRVRALRWRFDIIAGKYEQTISLGAV